MKKRPKLHKESNHSWFYKHFIKNTVNDNFNTPYEAINKKNNKELIQRVKDKILIENS